MKNCLFDGRIKILSIVGARPQLIKAAVVSRAIKKWNTNNSTKFDEIIVHTGQHYDKNMSKIFFDELEIPEPNYYLGVGSESHGVQTGRMLEKVEKVIVSEKCNLVITYGDTNSTLAGSLAAVKLHIPSAHIEAGLRSYDRRMPEEINRTITDQISNVLFCPTENAVKNLLREGIKTEKRKTPFDSRYVYNIGDVMYDSVLFYKDRIKEKEHKVLGQYSLSPGNYLLATVHRAENTDSFERSKNIIDALQVLVKDFKVIFPMHPRTKKCVDDFNLSTKGILIMSPVGYLDMLALEKNSSVILTDSGGVQKEAFLLRIPCITLRDTTEWIETVESGMNILVGAQKRRIIEETYRTFTKARQLTDDLKLEIYGNGHAGIKIIQSINHIFYKGIRNVLNLEE